jgi:hypothetical protein
MSGFQKTEEQFDLRALAPGKTGLKEISQNLLM